MGGGPWSNVMGISVMSNLSDGHDFVSDEQDFLSDGFVDVSDG